MLEFRTGIPLFIEQLQHTLEAEEQHHPGESLRISGAAGGDPANLSEMGVGATAHGRELLGLGYSVDEVVHTYGDLCQSVTDLAFELNALFAVAEFRPLPAQGAPDRMPSTWTSTRRSGCRQATSVGVGALPRQSPARVTGALSPAPLLDTRADGSPACAR